MKRHIVKSTDISEHIHTGLSPLKVEAAREMSCVLSESQGLTRRNVSYLSEISKTSGDVVILGSNLDSSTPSRNPVRKVRLLMKGFLTTI